MPPVSVVVPSSASPLRQSIADLLVEHLRRQGAEIEVLRDQLPAPGATGLVLDPHDGLERIASAAEIGRFLRRSVVLSTAAGPDGRPRDRPFLEVAAAAAVTSPLLAGRMASEGSIVERVGIAFDPAYLGAPAAERTIDVAVLLPDTEGRSRLVASLAESLAPRAHEIRLDYARELLGRSATELAVQARRELLARTRIVLFAPDDRDRACLDWLHVHDVLANGCCLVAVRTMDLDPLTPGDHLVAAGPSSVRLVIDEILSDPAWERTVGDAGRALVEDELSLTDCAATLLELAMDLPSPTGRRFVPSTRTTPPDDGRREVAEVVARVALENAAFRRGRGDAGRAPELIESPGCTGADPLVTIVMPVHDGEAFIEAAIESALASSLGDVEVVVIDDASSDGSAARVRALMERWPERAIRLLTLASQSGIGAARNHGFRLARAPLVVPLDADDLLFPLGLARLRAALEREPAAAFSYGIIERFNADGPIDVMSTQGFDGRLFAFGNYISVMALVRRSAWERVDGYCEGGTLQIGWEDYDFWLRLVDAGQHGIWTPELIARYRRPVSAAPALYDIVSPVLAAHIRREHPHVFEGAPS